MKSFRKIITITVLFFVAAVPLAAAANIQALQDWSKLRNYSPPAQVSQLSTQDTMTPVAQHLFYLNHPQLVADKANFRQNCPQAEQTIVLGCYHSTQDGIFVFNAGDPRLNGITQVTAAHETLHAAYDRMSQKDKNNVDSLLQNFYNTGLTDKRIKDTIAAYQKTEPHDVVNEMHSIFGTEVANLPAPLEEHYKKYFDNRQAVVAFSNQYESVFIQNQNRLNTLKSQIDTIKSQLDIQKQDIQDQQNALENQRSQMQSELADGQNDRYNSQVGAYNSKVSVLKSEIASYNSKVSQLNDLVTEYNQIAYTQNDLYNSINTSIQTQPAQ
jgi:hypothetical protein